ncbi:hypothetical protein MTO96_002036 [Rhipicephalus appendiculatus]
MFVSELYTGWCDRWAVPHRHVDGVMVASTLRQVLLAGASVNLYMFHGGTSFGFSAGARMVPATGRKDEFLYRPYVTSYDFRRSPWRKTETRTSCSPPSVTSYPEASNRRQAFVFPFHCCC